MGCVTLYGGSVESAEAVDGSATAAAHSAPTIANRSARPISMRPTLSDIWCPTRTFHCGQDLAGQEQLVACTIADFGENARLHKLVDVEPRRAMCDAEQGGCA